MYTETSRAALRLAARAGAMAILFKGGVELGKAISQQMRAGQSSAGPANHDVGASK